MFPAAGVAVRMTAVPAGYVARHVLPSVLGSATPASIAQLIPAGALVTRPLPVPADRTTSGGAAEKLARTEVACDTVTVQVPTPLHAPLHPVKVEGPPAAPAPAGVALSVTTVPGAKSPVQPVAPGFPVVIVHEIPAGALVTVPVPVPVPVTVSETLRVNVAVTVAAWSIMIRQTKPVAVHGPLHPPKRLPSSAGVATRFTTAPALKPAAHPPAGTPGTTGPSVMATPRTMLQTMPVGVLVTVPLPEPAPATVRTCTPVACAWKFAVVLRTPALPTVSVHVAPNVEHAPLHPVKVEPEAALAVSVTEVPGGKLALHPTPPASPAVTTHAIPPGVLAIVPVPVPAPFTATVPPPPVALPEKETVTVVAVVSDMAQAGVHPAEALPALGDWRSVTRVPDGKPAVHVPVAMPLVMTHAIPAGLLVTVPLPVPPPTTVIVGLFR
jgi:hypothetical protein